MQQTILREVSSKKKLKQPNLTLKGTRRRTNKTPNQHKEGDNKIRAEINDKEVKKKKKDTRS